MIKPKHYYLLILMFSPLATAQDEVTVDWFAYTQLTAEHFEDSGKSVDFDAERVRSRAQLNAGAFSLAGQLDLGVDNWGDKPPGTLANVIMDLYVDYRFSDNHRLRFGQFKTPLGMDFNDPAHALDITKRGMEFGLTFNRDIGIMLSGENVINGFSYDVGIFNTPGRSQAMRFSENQVGDDEAQVARLRYDSGAWHAEAASGRVDNAGGVGTQTYTSQDIGIRTSINRWQLKSEWIRGRNVLGTLGRREDVYYLHATYALTPKLDIVGRYYGGRSSLAAAETKLSNTYVGISSNIHELGNFRARLQINYVHSAGDKTAYTGVRGFRSNALLLQMLVYVEN